MSSAQGAMVSIELTRKQQWEIADAAGTVKRKVELPLLQLIALTLAAQAAGRDVLPVARSPRTIERILHPRQERDDEPPPFTVVVPLSPEQQDQIRSLTGRVLSSFEVAPYETNIRYRETVEGEPGPVRVGASILIVPSDVTDPTAAHDRVIVLPKGDGSSSSVWGTGKHPTTRLAIMLLEEYVRADMRVLDVGTGTGVLAVAAARLGAAQVTAVDIDPDSVACAEETARLNGLGDVIHVGMGSIEAGSGTYDLIVMNVLPHVIIPLSGDLVRALQPGGYLIISGVPSERASQSVIAALESRGFLLQDRRTEEGWIACMLRASSA